MLGHLVDYARKHSLAAEPGFTSKTVKWAIDINTDSLHAALFALGDERTRKGQAFARCPELTQPELIGGDTPRCNFLVETAEVVALYVSKDEGTPAERRKADERRRAKHAYFLGLLRRASAQVAGLEAAAGLLDETPTLSALQEQFKSMQAKSSDKVTLRVNGHFPVEGEGWHAWWHEFRGDLAGAPDDERPQMVSFLSGDLVAPLAVQPKIIGLAGVGGLPTGDAFTSFDKVSFSSFGLVQGENAAVSETQFSMCRAALNHLIHHSYRTLGVRLVHWFKEEVPPEHDPVALVFDPGETNEAAETTALVWAREALGGVREGRVPQLGHNRFFILALSGAAGRVMVRGFQDGAFEGKRPANTGGQARGFRLTRDRRVRLPRLWRSAGPSRVA
jgi:CRISPR-associated protein Csd1